MRASALILAAVLLGCSAQTLVSEKEMAAIEAEAAVFHTHLASGDGPAIYRMADDGFRAKVTPEFLANITERFHAGSAGCAEPRRDPERVNVTNRAMLVGEGTGRFVTVTYIHECGARTITETLMFRMSRDTPKLLGLHLHGPQFAQEPLAPTPEPGHTLPPLPPAEPETAPAVVLPSAG